MYNVVLHLLPSHLSNRLLQRLRIRSATHLIRLLGWELVLALIDVEADGVWIVIC